MRRWSFVACALVAGCGFEGGRAYLGGDAPAAGSDSGDAPADVALDGTPIPADWWDASWAHRRKITIDTSTLAASLTKFPVLVTLNQTNFDFAGARADGGDLRVIASDHTTVVPYDLDTWSTTDTSSLWVAIDLVPATPTYVWLYYGNSSAASGATPAMVWTSFVSVHHLADFTDATGNGNNGVAPTTPATSPTLTAGMIGGAQAFNGTSSAIPMPTNTAYDFTTAMSVSVWARPMTFTSTWECFVCKGDSSWRLHRDNTNRGADFGTTSGGINTNLGDSTTVDDSQWHHIAIWYDGTNRAISVDGGPKATGASNALSTTSYRVVIGRNEEATTPTNRWFLGDLDEVRISAQPRGAPWFQTEHRTVTDPTFAQVGAEQSIR